MNFTEVLKAAAIMILWIVLAPFWLLIGAIVYLVEKIEDLRFRRYLRTVGSAKYFCYTDKPNSQPYVRENILPFLPPDVDVLHISSRRAIDLDKRETFPRPIVKKLKSLRRGFPCLAKVSDGTLLAESINREVFTAITQNKNGDQVNLKIKGFFEGDTT